MPDEAPPIGRYESDMRQLLVGSDSTPLLATVQKFVKKFKCSHSSGMALICLAALLLADAIRPQDRSAAASLLLASDSLHVSSLQEDSFLDVYQQIIKKWGAAGIHDSVAWLQWLLSQPRPETGSGLSDTALETTPCTWLKDYAVQPTCNLPVEGYAAARQQAARMQHQFIPFVHFVPPSRGTTAEEASWLDDVLKENPQTAALRELLLAGTKGRLLPEQCDEADLLLAAGGGTVSAAAPQPIEIGSLLHHNQRTAAGLLAALLPSSQADQYLQAMADAGVTISALETIGQMVREAAPLPSSFLRSFVSQCLSSCNVHQEATVTARQVRMVCAFLSMLLRDKLADLTPMLPALQAFCIEQSRHREAAHLFGRLKELETSVGPPD